MANMNLTEPKIVAKSGQNGPHGGIEAVRGAVHGARAALASVLEAAGVDATKTRETARALNLNRGLVWRVSRAVGAEDDVTAAANLPGQVGLDRLLDACRERGVSGEMLETVRVAVRRFHEVASNGFGDRRTLEILLANSGERSTSLDLESARRAMFDGGCAVWGVRAEVRLRNMFLFPSREDPSRLDEAGVAGYVGLRRLRKVPWPVSYQAVYTDSGDADAPTLDLIDEGGTANSSLPLLREFCSPADLSVNLARTSRGVRHELPPTADFGADPVTCVFGAIYRRLYTARSTESCRVAGSLVVMDTPVERVMVDCFVHRSLELAPPSVALVDRLTRPHGFNADELAQESLPFEVQPRRLGPGSAASVTPQLPWYPRLVDRVCARIGHTADEFVAYRVEMVYPPIPTALIVQFSLPE